MKVALATLKGAAGGAGCALRRASERDYPIEIPAALWRRGNLLLGQPTEAGRAKPERVACQDRPTSCGNRFFLPPRSANWKGRAESVDGSHTSVADQPTGPASGPVAFERVLPPGGDFGPGSAHDAPDRRAASGAAIRRRQDARDLLGLEGWKIGRKHVTTLMRRMGIAAIYRRKNTSRPHPEHTVFPYLLRRLSIDRPNQVWASDVT